MNPDATRNLLIRRRELTGETFNDHTIQSWQDLLEGTDYRDAVDALNTAATQHERVNARHLHEHLPGYRPSRETRTVGMEDCPECDGTGFSGHNDRFGTLRMAPCTTCRPADFAKCDVDNSPSGKPPTQFASMKPDVLAERARDWATRTVRQES